MRSRTRVIAAGIVLAVVASGCSAETGNSVAGGNSDWDPQQLPAIPVAATSANEPLPVYGGSVVTENQGLAVSLQPTLHVTTASPGESYQFQVTTVGGVKDTVVFTGSAPTNQITVAAGALAQGNVYLWTATPVDNSKPAYGPYVMAVDAIRSGIQPSQSFGPLSVDLANGQVSYSSSMRAVSGASGSLGVHLQYRAGQPGKAGLPGGWAMQASNLQWSHVQMYPGGAVGLVTNSGAVTAFTPTEGGGYSVLSAAGRPIASGQAPALSKNSDGTWTATMTSGLIAVFGQADSSGKAWLTEQYNGVAPSPVLELNNGQLTAVKDSIAPDLKVDLRYEGQDDCPDVPDGFAPTPSGMLCSITYPNQTSTSFFYLTTAANQPLLARIVDYPETSDGKADVTDIGYDQTQRIVAVRQPAAANAQAAGVRTDEAALLTTVGYDWTGRAQSVTKPAAQAGQPQKSYKLEYANNAAATTIVGNGPETSTGYIAKHIYDPTTMLSLSVVDSEGRATQQNWDTTKDLLLSNVADSGDETKYLYDDQDRQTGVVGPFPASEINSAAAPKRTYTYDQDVSGANPKEMNGFNLTYWANDQLTGVPAGRDFGPTFSGNIPTQTQWTWPSPPVSTDGSWGARLTGLVAIPGSSSAKPANYGFKITGGNATLWIDNVACSQGNCQFPLTPGVHQIRLDLAVPDANSGGIGVAWQPPGQSQFTAIPMNAITPGYGLQATASQNDALSATQPYLATQVTSYADPWTNKATASWVQELSDMRGESQYADFDPVNGTFGQLTTRSLPAGNQINYSTYAPGDEANIPCDGVGSIPQYGRHKSTTRSTVGDGSDSATTTQTYTTYYDVMGNQIAGQINDSDASCNYFNDRGQVVKRTLPGRGNEASSTIETTYNFNGNPLQSQVTVQTGSQTYTLQAEYDLYGKLLNSSDFWGTKQSFTYDPYTAKLIAAQVTTASGYTTTAASSFDANGKLQSVSLDGKVVASINSGVPGSFKSTVTYGNGVVQRFTPRNAANSQTWQDTAGKTFTYNTQKSPAGRMLAEQLSFDSTKATYDYTYDAVGRLTNAQLQTSLPVSHSNWSYAFDNPSLGTNPKAGLNGNRISKTVDGTTTNYGYNGHDQLTATSDELIGNTINYSNWGEITNLGPLTLDYNGGGQTTALYDNNGNRQDFHYAGGALLQKTTTTAGQSPIIQRYTAGGLILDGNNTPQWQVVPLPGGTTLIRSLAGEQKWQHSTTRKQLMWTSDASGKDTGTRHLYSPFGEDLITDPAPPASGTDVPAPNYQWQGGRLIETVSAGNLQVIPMGARVYVPSLGRFTTPDPVDQGSANAYDYANQDPINQADPTGESPWWEALGIGIAMSLIAGLAGAVVMSALGDAGITMYAALLAGRKGVAGLTALVNLVTGSALAGVTYGVSAADNQIPFYGWAEAIGITALSIAVGGGATAILMRQASAAAMTITDTAADATADLEEPLVPAAARVAPEAAEPVAEVVGPAADAAGAAGDVDEESTVLFSRESSWSSFASTASGVSADAAVAPPVEDELAGYREFMAAFADDGEFEAMLVPGAAEEVEDPVEEMAPAEEGPAANTAAENAQILVMAGIFLALFMVSLVV